MKKKSLTLCLLAATIFAHAQNVGIGTISPLARLHVADSSVLFSAIGNVPLSTGFPPVQGSGRRMLWYSDKAAFRAGYVETFNWDKDSIGILSVATGYNTKANGYSSTAMGINTTASGQYSTAMGFHSTASAESSTAMGVATKAVGNRSTAMGSGTIASGNVSTAMGYATIASGSLSTAMGSETTASGTYSTALGESTVASGNISTAIGSVAHANADYSIAIGESISANAWLSTSLGRHNDPIVITPTTTWVLTEPLLIVGNGTGPTDKKNALVILKSGNIGLSINSPNAPLAFANNTGQKISLYESTANSQYGFAVAPAQLQIYSDAAAAKISFGYYNDGVFTERMFLTNSTGVLTVTGTNYPSDARLKMDIMPLQNSLQKIIKLNGYTYHWKNEQADKSLQTGVLAQEVQKLLPQLVIADKDGMLSVNYSGFIPVLIECIKEQQIQIDALAKHDKVLQKQIEELNNKMEKLLSK
ncbi:MAG: tail fiber domain-containing protein [Chitinophagales bacterium]